MPRVEWRHTAETSRFLRVLAATALGAIGSLFVPGAGLVTFLVASSLLTGELAVLAVIAFAGLLFARRLAVLARPRRRPPGSLPRRRGVDATPAVRRARR